MFTCPNCGEPVRDDAACCPHCGSDEETGWSPYPDDLLPEEEPEDEGGRSGGVSNAFAAFLVVVGLLGLAALGGFRALASPYSLLAAAAVVAGVLVYVRRSATC